MRAKNEMPTTEQVAHYVARHIAEHGWPPSRREIAGHFGISLERTQNLLRACAEEGLIKQGGGARQLKVMKQIEGGETKL